MPESLFTIQGIHVSIYDLLLIVAVSGMGTVLAYLHDPRWKALMLTLPIPFSLAFLSLGKPMGVTNVTGLLVLLGFTYLVYVLHGRWRWPILIAIVCSAAGYIFASIGLGAILPNVPAAFWGSFAAAELLGWWLYLALPRRDEPGHRTPLPVWIKLPLMALVVVVLVVLKLRLQGFMTVFPMVGVIAAYEARKSLWANVRAIPVIMISMGLMMAAIWLMQHLLGWSRGVVLAVGWLILLSTMLPLTRDVWAVPAKPAVLPEAGVEAV